MRQRFPMLLLAIIPCFFMTCDFSQEADDEVLIPENPLNYNFFTPPFTDVGVGLDDCVPHIIGSITPHVNPFVSMDVELVNNTNHSITIFTPGSFYYGPREMYHHFLIFHGRRVPLHTAAPNSTSSFRFPWVTSESLAARTLDGMGKGLTIYDEPYRCDNCFWSIDYSDAVIENWEPYFMSFFLEADIDGEAYYLAGWPQEMDMSNATLHWYEYEHRGNGIGDYLIREDFDSSRIVQYGIGYTDNKEPNIFFIGTTFREVQLPLNIHGIDAEGQPAVFSSWNNHRAIGKAVLTIDAPDKIEFRTISIEGYSSSQ